MIKLMGLIKRKDGMSVADFQAYWREVHGPIMARTPGMRRYIQCHALPELYGTDLDPPYDGVAEAWFDSLEAYREAIATPEWRAGAPDARNFMTAAGSLLVREVPIVDDLPSPSQRQGMVKYMGLLNRKEGLSFEEFDQHWLEVHGQLVAAELTTMRRYVQCHVLAEAYTDGAWPPYDGIPEAWFDSMETYPARLGRRGDAPPTTPGTRDSATFIHQPIPALVVREVVVLE